MEARAVKLPPGFKLDPPAQGVNLPPGFTLDSPADAAPPETPSILGRFASRTGFAGLSQVPGAIKDIAGQGVVGGAKALGSGLAGTAGAVAGEFAPSAIASQYQHLRGQGMTPVGSALGSIPLLGKTAETISGDVAPILTRGDLSTLPEVAGDIVSAAPMLLGSPGFRASPIANAPLGQAAKAAGKGALKVATNPVVVGAGTLAATGSPMTAIEATAGAIALRAAKDPTAFDSMAAMPGMVGRVGRAMKELSGKPTEEQVKIIRGLPENEWKLMQDHLEALKVNEAIDRAAQTKIAQAEALKEKYRGLSSPQELKMALDQIKAQEIDAKARGLSPDEFKMQRDFLEALSEDLQTRGAGKQGAAVAKAQIAASAEDAATRGLGRTELPKTQAQIAAEAENAATRGLGQTEFAKTRAQIAAEAQNTATRNLGPNEYPITKAQIAAEAEDAATRGLGSTEFPKTQAQIAAGEADVANRGVSPLRARMEQARIEAQKVQDASRGLSPNELALTKEQIAAQAANRSQRGVSPNEFETTQAQIAAKAEEAKRLKDSEPAAPVEDGVLKAIEGEKPAPRDGVLKAVEKPKTPKTEEIIKGIEAVEDPIRIRKANKAMARMVEYASEKGKPQYGLKDLVEGIRKSKNHEGVSEATLVKLAQGLRERMTRARRSMTSLVKDGTSLKEAAATGDLDLDMPSEFNIKVVRDAAREMEDRLNPTQKAELAEIQKMSNIRKTGESWYLPKKD